jgi:hypothetical protein
MPGPIDDPDVTLATLHGLAELAESLRALVKDARLEDRRLLSGSLELIAELEREKRRLAEERSAALDTSARLLAEALERERQLALLLVEERERSAALALDLARAAARAEAERGELERDLARQRELFLRSTSWRWSVPVRLAGRLLARFGVKRQG